MKLKKTKNLLISTSLSLLMAPAGFGQEESESPKKEKNEVIRVTGSRIRQIDVQSATSMTTFSRDDIERSGYANIADFLRNSIPSGAMSTENATLSQVGASANFGGRDFAAAYTLTLLNGRRLPINAIAADFVDINLIPMAAIERIEYLTDGASAIYGSDAVAGVLNIITRKNFDGTSLATRMGQSSRGDGQETSWQVVSGSSTKRSNFLITADSFTREIVNAKDRPLVNSAIAPDGTDGRSPNGLPGYIIRADGTIEPFADCPAGNLDGNNRCQYDFAPLYQAIPKSERQSLYTVFDYEVTDNVTLFGESRFSRAVTNIANGAAPGAVTLSGTAPTNPYKNLGESITLVRRYLDFGPRRRIATNESFSSIAGLKGDLWDEHSWSLEAASHKLQNLQVGAGGQINEPAVVEAFEAGTLDPFIFNVRTEANKDAFDKINTNTFREGLSTLQTYNLNLDGLLPFELAGGQVGYATGFEFRRETFSDKSDNLSKENKILGSAGSDGGGDRENEALFVELGLPILESVEVTAAVRADEIDHDKQATTYKVSSSYTPFSSLKVRASYGTGFKAPDLHDLFLGSSFGVTQAVDQQTCGDDEPCEINTISGGNKDLEPETSTSLSFGVISQLTAGLSLSLDYWDIKIGNKVDSLDLQSILNDPVKFGSLINRDANGRLNTTGAYVQTNLQNLTEEASAGVEVQLKYNHMFSFGKATSNLLVNKTIKSKSQTTATDPLCDTADLTDGPDGRLTLGWEKDLVETNLTLKHKSGGSSYTGGFTAGTCDFATPDSKYKVKSTNEVDVAVNYTSPWSTKFTVGVNNVTDQAPAFNKNEGWPWYSQASYSNMGRYYYLAANHSFE